MLNNDISHIFAIRISLPVQPMNGTEKKFGFMLKIYLDSCVADVKSNYIEIDFNYNVECLPEYQLVISYSTILASQCNEI